MGNILSLLICKLQIMVKKYRMHTNETRLERIIVNYQQENIEQLKEALIDISERIVKKENIYQICKEVSKKQCVALEIREDYVNDVIIIFIQPKEKNNKKSKEKIKVSGNVK